MTAGYIFENEGRQFDPNGAVKVENTTAHNAKLELAELAFWRTKPERFIAYITEKAGQLSVTTWLGTAIGSVIMARKSRNNLTGSRMCRVRIMGDNGAYYYGSYGCDWSQAVRLRRCKGE